MFPIWRRLRRRQYRGTCRHPVSPPPFARIVLIPGTPSEMRSRSSTPGSTNDRRNYSFKCHRYDIPAGSMPGTPAASSSSLSSSAGSQHVFAVNDICFHKTEGTFCTGGSDGSFTFWDGIARTKLKRKSPYILILSCVGLTDKQHSH
jgi:hypothetical protein